MIWQNSGFNLGDATLLAMQERPNLHGFASLCQRARHARSGLGSHNQTPPHASLDDGQGGPDSTPVS
jgi:hypothetical protein